jgi:hypothetical protein
MPIPQYCRIFSPEKVSTWVTAEEELGETIAATRRMSRQCV